MTLEELLERWRETRSPALADALDRVPNDRPAIESKTVLGRAAAWRQIAAQRDPHDVARLVVTAMPRTKRELERSIQHLIDWPDDPRIATALIRFLEDGHVYRAGTMLATRAVVRIGEIGDVRALPRLRALMPAIGVPAFDPIARLEAIVPDDRLDDLARDAMAVDEEALWAQLHEDPEDRHVLAVLGDALASRSDPRGTFIALSLAEPTEERTRKIAQLLEQHGRTWAGPLDRWFSEDRRQFVLGMFAGGRLAAPTMPDDDPAWRFVRTINVTIPAMVRVAVGLAAKLPALRVLGTIDGGHAVALKSRVLRELHLRAASIDLPMELPDLPALRALGLWNASTIGWWAARAPIVERLERLALTARDNPADFAALADRPGALRTIEVHGRQRLWFDDPDDWHVELSRAAAPGPFTRFVATRIAHDIADMVRLVERLRAIPDRWLREIVVHSAKPVLLSADDQGRFEEQVARHPGARVEVPWPRATAPSPDARRLRVAISGPNIERAGVGAVLELTGTAYDAFRIDSGRELRPLGKDPAAKIASWVTKPRVLQVIASASGSPLELEYQYKTRATAELAIDPDRVDDFVERFVAFAGREPFGHAVVQASGAMRFRDLGITASVPLPPASWLMAFPRELRDRLDPDELATAAANVWAIGDRVIVKLVDDPDEVVDPVIAPFKAVLARRFGSDRSSAWP